MPRGRTKEQGAPPELIEAGRRTQVLLTDMPKCKALSRRTGKPCQQPAISDGQGLCRHHVGYVHRRKMHRPDAKVRRELFAWVRSARVPAELARMPIWAWARERGFVVRAAVLRAWTARDQDNGRAWREVLSMWREGVHG